MAELQVLEVLLHNRPIGTLTHLGGDQTLFAFNQSYIDDAARDTLSLSFKDRFGSLLTTLRPTQTRVAPFFANLLPEAELRDYLALRANVNPKREFHLLWVLGEDLAGAISVRSADGQMPPPSNGIKPGPLAPAEQPFRFALAGVQLKFSAVMAATGGLTIPVTGAGGSWIVKLPSVKFAGVPQNEFAMMTLARKVGIDVPDIRLIDTAEIEGLPDAMKSIETTAYAIKRFDRLDGNREEDGGAVHIEDFAQVFAVYPEEKYKNASYRNIAGVIAAEAGEVGTREFVRRLVFNALIGNADMHLKNWSLIYRDRRTAALSPAYDFVSTIAFLPDDKLALNVSRTKKFAEFSAGEIAHLAAKARLPQKPALDTARETVERFLNVWAREKNNLDLPRATVATIDAHLGRVPIVAEAGGGSSVIE